MTPNQLSLPFVSSLRGLLLSLASLPVGMALASSPALAHSGFHSDGFAAGALHPLTGADHLLAMLAVGLWASGLSPKARLLVPAVFVVMLSFGAVLGTQGAFMPGLETAIAISVILLGLAAALRLPLPLPAAMAVVALFAAAHGIAHGAEMPAMAAPLAYGLGFTSVTSLLHAAGVCLGISSRNPVSSRLAGGTIAAAGLVVALAG